MRKLIFTQQHFSILFIFPEWDFQKEADRSTHDGRYILCDSIYNRFTIWRSCFTNRAISLEFHGNDITKPEHHCKSDWVVLFVWVGKHFRYLGYPLYFFWIYLELGNRFNYQKKLPQNSFLNISKCIFN